MNLLKQTALILGLASLSIAAWTLYRNWRKRIAIQFFVLCFFVAIWALSFVTHVTLDSRLSYDIHRFFNIWLAPIGVILVTHFLTHEDRFSRIMKLISAGGALILSLMVAFSLQSSYDSSPYFKMLVQFWPTTVFIQFLNVLFQDFILKKPVSFEFISTQKRILLYVGVTLTLSICTFDHIPELGYVIPSIGNLLFTVFLAFASLVIFPQKLLRLESLMTRFFAILSMALVITGFFALMFQYVSGSFPLFLLNSFLISFAVMVLWNPLLSLFRFLGKKLLKTEQGKQQIELDQFEDELAGITDLKMLEVKIKEAMKKWLQCEDVRFVTANEFSISREVENFFLSNDQSRDKPILHRRLIQLEIEQELTREYREKLRVLLRFLNHHACDIVFPVIRNHKIQTLVLLKSQEESSDEWSVGFGFYSQIYITLQEVGVVLERLFQIEEAKDSERLILLGEMAAGLAHEIRNPLGAIRGAAELLSGENKKDNQWSQVIIEEVQRLNRLVSQFLDLSSNPKELPETCDLIAIIESTIRNIRHSVSETIIFRASQEKGASVLIYAVPDHVQQVIINLIQNAVQAETTSIEINLIETKRNDKEYAGFEVVDSGMGMTEIELSLIFQPFYTTFKKGTGLGLSICERLLRYNGGWIEIDSRIQVGTTVKVYWVKHAG